METSVDPAAAAARKAWLWGWRALARYHRYTVEGLEHLGTGRSVLIAGYHGRPIAHDLAMLSVKVHDTYGHMPHAVFHQAFGESAALRAVMHGVGGITGDGETVRTAIDRGEHILVTPGGTREGCRSALHRHRVEWGRRTGYLRLAHRYGLPIVPVAARGTDWTYIGLNDGYALGKKLGAPHGLPVWVGLGVGGLWPASLPLPVRIRQRIGPPIELPAVDPDDRDALLAQHGRVVASVQELLDAP